jgi:hypothetical protein
MPGVGKHEVAGPDAAGVCACTAPLSPNHAWGAALPTYCYLTA